MAALEMDYTAQKGMSGKERAENLSTVWASVQATVTSPCHPQLIALSPLCPGGYTVMLAGHDG